jgi:adenylate kinase
MHRNDARRLVLLGPPGCGKGTQAALLSQRLCVPAISTGDMLRAAVAAGSELGAHVQGIMARGALVDDDTMAAVVRERLTHDDASHGFMLDGYPRTEPQAETLDTILEERGQELDAVLFFEVPDEVLVERVLKRNRADDTDTVIRQRLRVYAAETSPLVDHYASRGLLRRVDGNQPIEAVTPALLRALEA